MGRSGDISLFNEEILWVVQPALHHALALSLPCSGQRRKSAPLLRRKPL